MNDTVEVPARPAPRKAVAATRRWLFRLASVFCGLSLFGAFELFCAAADWGRADVGEDPFVGFTSIRPLFALTPAADLFHTSPARRGFFREVSFAAKKPPGEFRIFVFGGSTVQGNPFSIETSFPSYLQIALEQADPARSWKVVNCGGVSYASYRLLPVMQECLSYQPDLFVFCEGHNEFLEDVSYADVRQTPVVVQQGYSLLSRLRSFRLLQQAVHRRPLSPASGATPIGTTGKPLLPGEVNTLLDHDGGLDAYHRDDQHAAVVRQHFRSNLQRMIDMCQSHAIPLLTVLPPSNLSDCPPFKSEYSAATTDDNRSTIHALLKEARDVSPRDVRQAISIVQQATDIDRRYAFSWYELGQLQLSAGDNSAADDSFRRARDEDVCPLRITTPLETALQEAAETNHVPLINAHELLRSRCPHGIIGKNVLVDHVHPSFRGHEDIAVAIADWMLAAGLLTSTNVDWKLAAQRECRTQLQSLDDLYFLRGRRALESLKLWAAGRSGGPPLILPQKHNEPTKSVTSQAPTD